MKRIITLILIIGYIFQSCENGKSDDDTFLLKTYRLYKIENKNELVKSYIEYKNQVLEESDRNRFGGFISFNFIACGLLNNNVDLTDYVVKRIIIIELLIK
jgi:hypothetical protein